MAERLNVNPTRMELLALKDQIETARRGHKLLKDKRDELMRVFLNLVDKTRELREKVEKNLSEAFASFLMGKAVMSEDTLESAIMFSDTELEVAFDKTTIMGVPVAEFTADAEQMEGEMYPYGFTETSGDLDNFMRIMTETLPDLVKLAEVEKSLLLLAEEIEKTRRRVNALEYVLIPRQQETIRYITMKLDERERSNLTRLMKIKDMIRS
ncbi:MAG: V-type ATP synthase subunit D [bacterium]